MPVPRLPLICKVAMRLRIEPAFIRRLFHGSTNHQRNAKRRQKIPLIKRHRIGRLAPRGEATDMVNIMSPKDAGYIPSMFGSPTHIPSLGRFSEHHPPPLSSPPPSRFDLRSEPLGLAHNPLFNSSKLEWFSPLDVSHKHRSQMDASYGHRSKRPNPQYHYPSGVPSSETLLMENRPSISKPSKKSGGVPDPTQQYIDLASQPPLLLPQPRNLLVVIDLNGTLLYRPNPERPKTFTPRPYAQSFLSYCIHTFTVVIWSSARPHNVENMCYQLLTKEDRDRVVAIMARNTFGLTQADYLRRVMCYKRLELIWRDEVVAASHPRAAHGEKWNQFNTVLIDDTTEKGRSEPHNLICVPSFEGLDTDTDLVLPQVHDYLNTCSQQFNVSAYIRSQPFALNPEFTLGV